MPSLSWRRLVSCGSTLYLPCYDSWALPSLSGPSSPVMQCSVAALQCSRSAAWQCCSVAACALPSIGSQRGGSYLPPFWNVLQTLLPSPLSGRLLARVQPLRRVRDNTPSWPMSGVPSKRRLEATNERRRSSLKYRLWPRRRRGFQSQISHREVREEVVRRDRPGPDTTQ
jgi:hypothetical protein